MHKKYFLNNKKKSFAQNDYELKNNSYYRPYNQCKSTQFHVVAIQWFESIKVQTKESTQNKYWNTLELYVLPDLGKYMINEITDQIIEEHCSQLLKEGGVRKAGLSPKSVGFALSLVRSILKFADRRGEDVICDGTTIRISHERSEMRIFSKSEQKVLCEYLRQNINGCNIGILMCLFTGLRIGEICALRWEDISFDDKCIMVRRTMQRIQDRDGNKKTKIVITSPKSACSVRAIPIPESLLDILVLYKCTKKGYVLTNSASTFIEPRVLQNRFKNTLIKIGIKQLNFHALRHTFATRCIELGFDIKCLSEILGHASVNITMNRYVHPPMSLKYENMQKLSRFGFDEEL